MEEDPNVPRLMVAFLRFHSGLTQTEFGRAAGVNQGYISRYESGDKVPTEEVLVRLARAAGVPWTLAVHLRRFVAAFLAATHRRTPAAPPAPPGTDPLEQAVLENVRLALSAYRLPRL